MERKLKRRGIEAKVETGTRASSGSASAGSVSYAEGGRRAQSRPGAILIHCCRRLGNGSGGRRRLDGSLLGSGEAVAVDLSLGALAGDVAGLAAAVAGLASSVQRATVGSGAVARDVAELSAGVALHGLSLAVAGKVVGAAALVASSRARAASETAAEATVATARDASAAANAAGGVGAGARKVSGLSAGVAAAAGASAAQAQSGAVSLNVAEALAVVALLRLGGARVRAAVALVAWSWGLVVEGRLEWRRRGSHTGLLACASLLAGASLSRWIRVRLTVVAKALRR